MVNIQSKLEPIEPAKSSRLDADELKEFLASLEEGPKLRYKYEKHRWWPGKFGDDNETNTDDPDSASHA